MNKEKADTITSLSKHLLDRPKREFNNELYIESVKLFIDITTVLYNEVIDKQDTNHNNIIVKVNPLGYEDEI